MNISLGRDSITGNEFSIDSTKHVNIEGMSGMGKSTLLVNLFVEHIRQGNGGLFIDPHGDTADQIARLIPKSRMRDFIWIDPDASLVPPFNPLHFNSPEELELGKESLFTTFKSLAGSASGDESARVIINAIDAVREYFDHPTPVHIFRFMADDKFREKTLAAIENRLLQMFKEQYDEKLRDSEQMRGASSFPKRRTCRPQFKDEKTGETKYQDVAKILFSGDAESKNISINRATLFGLIDAFGEESASRMSHILTVETEKVLVPGRRVTAGYLIPENYETVDEENGYTVIVKKGAKVGTPEEPPDI